MKKNHYLLIVMLFLSISHVWAWDGDTDLTIKDATEFKAFIEASTNNNFAGKTIVLTNNIDFANETITPIREFHGIFDGKGYTISNFSINDQKVNTGTALFAYINFASAKILNLNINNVNITNTLQVVAVLIGNMTSGSIENCSVSNSTVTGNQGKCAILIGKTWNCTAIRNCYIYNCKTKTADNNQTSIGILVGELGGAAKCTDIKNCIAINSTIDNGKDNSRGFICGAIAKNYNISITNCYADGNEPLFATSIIPDNNFKVDTYSGIKNTSFFANPESAWILNTTNGTVANSKVWSHNGTNPIFADATNGAIVKAGAIDGETQTYAKGNEVLATDFKYITFDANNSEITDYSTLTITPTNPNALIYLPTGATLSKNNVVIGNGCANLVLTDGHDFVCPTSFTATKATYTRNCYIDGGWETIVLPFNVTDIKSGGTSVKGDYTVEGYTNTSGTTVKFTELTNITDWKADNAYILKHNSVETGTQECTFEGAGTIAATPADADFTGTYTLISNDLAAGNYALNAAGTEFGPLAASTETAVIPAFRAYLKKGNGPNPAKYSVEHDNGATGINNAQQASTIIYADGESIIINSEKAQTINVYSIDGRKAYNTIAEEGTTTINGLPKGIYIVNNQKVILK